MPACDVIIITRLVGLTGTAWGFRNKRSSVMFRGAGVRLFGSHGGGLFVLRHADFVIRHSELACVR